MTSTLMFATVGISTKKGNMTKFRFTNRGAEAYGDILIKETHTNVQFMDLVQPMNKADAVAAFVAQYPQFAEISVPGMHAERVAKGTGKPRAKAAKLTPEQVEAAKLAAKRARDAAAKREKRAAVKTAVTAEADASSKLDAALAALDEAMGGEVPVVDVADETTVETLAEA
tara:strand:+ start:213 stop:725 length:513 start_codon:yes stop_codon:yes gene_type:complete